MKHLFTSKPIVVATILTILLCSGFYFYAQWDTKRFMQELGVPPTFDSTPEPYTHADRILTNEPQHTSEPIDALQTFETPQPIETAADIETPPMLTERHEFLELHEEVIDIEADPLALDDHQVETPTLEEEPVEGGEYSAPELSDFLAMVEATSPDTSDTDIVTNVLAKMADGTASSQDILNMASAWLRILPEEDYVNRASLATFLNDMYELRRHEESQFTQVIGVEYTFDVYTEE